MSSKACRSWVRRRSSGLPDLPYRPCVGVVLCNADGRVFAGERVGMPGAWQMPQGGIDPGETPLEAAYRELAEETSVPAAAVELVGEHPDWLSYDFPPQITRQPFKGRYRGQTQRWFLFRLTAPDSVIDLVTDHPEFKAWEWLEPGDVLARIVDFKRPIYAQVLDWLQTQQAP